MSRNTINKGHQDSIALSGSPSELVRQPMFSFESAHLNKYASNSDAMIKATLTAISVTSARIVSSLITNESDGSYTVTFGGLADLPIRIRPINENDLESIDIVAQALAVVLRDYQDEVIDLLGHKLTAESYISADCSCYAGLLKLLTGRSWKSVQLSTRDPRQDTSFILKALERDANMHHSIISVMRMDGMQPDSAHVCAVVAVNKPHGTVSVRDCVENCEATMSASLFVKKFHLCFIDAACVTDS